MTAQKLRAPITAKNAVFSFYDIESLDDVFTVAIYTPRHNSVELFYLVEPGTALDQAVTAATRDASAFAARIGDAVFAGNPAFKKIPTETGTLERSLRLHDLGTQAGIARLAKFIGLFAGADVNDPDCSDIHSGVYRPVCDTDERYDPFEHHPFLTGYNSYNYDTTMLALLFMESFISRTGVDESALENMPVVTGEPEKPSAVFCRASARALRRHNDALFSDLHRSFMPSYLTDGEASIVAGQSRGWNSPAALIRKAMLDSGRHIDAARLNEAQRMVALKRLLGGLGRQILESDKLGGHNSNREPISGVTTIDELVDLLVYNVSDVVGLAKLFEHPAYSSTFDLKIGLLTEYPETVYDRIRGTHRPNISPKSVRMGRLTPDSTSAKFVARILAPYKPLEDIPKVSFLYPSERVAKLTGRKRRNVLDDSIEFFEKSIDKSTPAGRLAHEQFHEAMKYYRSIEGRNFNEEIGVVETPLSKIARTPNNLPYFAKDGTPSSCFVTFSTGGIHGAEYDVGVYEAASAAVDDFNARITRIRELYPEPLDFWEAHPGKKVFTFDDGESMTRAQVLTPATSLKLLKAEREARRVIEDKLSECSADEAAALWAEHAEAYALIGYRPVKERPPLFEKTGNGATKLKPQFVHTSASLVTHEDFTSYYPNLLRNMSAFYNADLGEDRYAKIFEDKERYGREMRKPGISPEEKTRLDVLRNGTKLILNSASGAGDTTHRNPIRMNNQIISMRIIGQLFSWRIGQAQTLAGARIISTNTDGLYSILDAEINDRVLKEQAAMINVEIEPERLWLISKDSNNRLELAVDDSAPLHRSKIISASGGTLACHAGPQPTKSLAHPAVIDWALAGYLREIAGSLASGARALSLDEPLNRDVGLRLMTQARDQTDALHAARLFQNVLAASPGKLTFPFATDPVHEHDYVDVSVPLDPHDVGPGTEPRTRSEVRASSLKNARPLQHYNRVFIMRKGTPETVSIQAAGAWVVTESSRRKRVVDGTAAVTTDPVALKILKANGYSRDGSAGTTPVPADQDIAVRRVPRLDPEWSMRVDNRDLAEMDPQQIRAEILAHLDLDAYVQLLASTFEENWMNVATDPSSESEASLQIAA